MNVKLFKKLIKETVSEAVREELNFILNNNSSFSKINESQTFNFTTSDINERGEIRNQLKNKMSSMFGLESNNKNIPSETDNKNPYLSFIMDAAANMTPQDKAGLSNLE
jgi:hypothetical protein